ncbi:unnamed protein product, partial [Larinioides sclopetarius]
MSSSFILDGYFWKRYQTSRFVEISKQNSTENSFS